ncbi:MAG: phosphatidylglycerol lysyltransferase domain-containing protein [Anaerolineaceae bacterium]
MKNEPAPLKRNGYSSYEKAGVQISAFFAFVMGLVNLISVVQPALMNRLAIIEPVIPLEVRHGSRVTAALAGFGLLLLANSLGRRKRVAWLLTLALLAVSIVSHLIKGLDFEESTLSLALFFLLILLRNSFHAESDQPSIRQGLYALGAAFIFTLAYGTIGFDLLDRHFSARFDLAAALRQTLVMFTEFYSPGLQPITGFGRYFAASIYVIGFATIGFAAFMLIRPVLVRQPASADERKRAEGIVNGYGRTALARATLFDDKSYFFDSEDVVISYGVSGRGAMVLGDPIGAADHIADAIVHFRDLCTHKDWTPSFVSTLPDFLDAYRAAGFDVLCIGYEAIVPLEGFSLEGSKNKDLRNVVSRMTRGQYRAEVTLPPLDDAMMSALREISNAWLTLRKGGEMHFSDGWFEDKYIRNSPVIVIYDAANRPIAFANLVSEYQKNEITIDLMRHYPKMENGVMDFLFVQMLQWAKEKGYATFSLGLSAIVGVGEKPEDPQVEKALHTISEYVSRFYNFKGLHQFKDKFHPQWEPRYLIYPGPGSLPLIANTLLSVHSGKNFLSKFLQKQNVADSGKDLSAVT